VSTVPDGITIGLGVEEGGGGGGASALVGGGGVAGAGAVESLLGFELGFEAVVALSEFDEADLLLWHADKMSIPHNRQVRTVRRFTEASHLPEGKSIAADRELSYLTGTKLKQTGKC
jgi:hypothetical protein